MTSTTYTISRRPDLPERPEGPLKKDMEGVTRYLEGWFASDSWRTRERQQRRFDQALADLQSSGVLDLGSVQITEDRP